MSYIELFLLSLVIFFIGLTIFKFGELILNLVIFYLLNKEIEKAQKKSLLKMIQEDMKKSGET